MARSQSSAAVGITDAVWWCGATRSTSTFNSEVHTKSVPCSTGTTHADGSAIDTALIRQAWPRRALIVVVIVAILAGVPALVVSIRRRDAEHRSRENYERDLDRDHV